MLEQPVPAKEVKILYYIEAGEQCWSLDLDDIEKCKRRGYPYFVASYNLLEGV
jgi:hypothetical protein